MKLKALGTALCVAACVFTGASRADDLRTEAAVGGAIGGALGGAIGAEVGGRQGAVIGAGIGAASGAAIATEPKADKPMREPPTDVAVVLVRPDTHFCPPGQAKKGRC